MESHRYRKGKNNIMKTMTHKGYTAEIIYSDEDECFVGCIANIDAISGFHGDTDEELRVAFEDMVDLYIRTREAPDPPPHKPYVWRLLARLRQALHL